MKNMTRCFARSVIPGTTKYELARKANCSSFMSDDTVPPSDRNLTYGGTFSINCKEFSNFFYNYSVNLM